MKFISVNLLQLSQTFSEILSIKLTDFPKICFLLVAAALLYLFYLFLNYVVKTISSCLSMYQRCFKHVHA